MKKNIVIAILIIVTILFFVYAITQQFRAEMHASIAQEKSSENAELLKQYEEDLSSTKQKVKELELKLEECEASR